MMKATEYIDKLSRLVDQHGDLDCVDAYDEPISDPEEVDGKFVLADRT